MLKIDGHDDALIGPACIWRNNTQVSVLVYDAETIRETLMQNGMSSEEAREYIEFNIEGEYMGMHTPIVVWTEDTYDLWDDWEEVEE